jgi:antitoxin component YwqK of YwqJK toxin-antitoxin module
MKKTILSLLILISYSLSAQTVDANGKKQGYWKKKDDNGKMIYEGEFKDDKPVGVFKHYYAGDTAKRAVTYFKDGGNIAYTKMYHQLTNKLMAEGKYIKEQKDSVWNFYDEAGILISKDNYKMGKKDGKCLVYLPDGAVAEEKIFKDGLEDGAFKQYFDGKLVKAEGKYVKGKMDGKVSYYYPNGTVAATGIYKNGLKEGVWLYKDKDGKPKEKEIFKNGVEITPKKPKTAATGTATTTNTTSVKTNTANPKGK